MDIRKIAVISLGITSCCFSLVAQEKWSLSQCIDYAVQNNIQVKQKQLEKEKKLQATLFSSFPLRLIIKSIIFAPNWFRIVYLLFGLKGNRVQIPDSPAAVKLCWNLEKYLCH